MGRRIDFVELLIKEAQHQGWLAKNREFKFIQELVSIQSDATGYLLEFMFQQMVEDEKMAMTYTFIMTRYLFAKSIEATIAWGHTKDGKISIYYDTKHLIDDNKLEFEIPEIYQKYTIDSLKVGESLFNIYDDYIANEKKIGEKVNLYSSTKELFNWIQKLGIHYALENKLDILWKYEKEAVKDEDEELLPSLKMLLLKSLIEDGQEYVKSSRLPFVPELLSVDQVILKIIMGIKEEDPNVSDTIIFGWCCYAGIGATLHWHLNWSQLKKNGIYETLTKERGISEMDEYVLDLIGMPYQKREAKRLTKHILKSSHKTLYYMNSALEDVNDDEKSVILMECCKGMYMYGMAIQLNSLGMH